MVPELVADEVELFDAIRTADLVITGEGFVDEQSFYGKVVGGICNIAEQYKVPVATICGDVDDELNNALRQRASVTSLVKSYGEEESHDRVLQSIERAAHEILTKRK